MARLLCINILTKQRGILMDININFNLPFMENFMSQFVENFKATMAEVKAQIVELDTVNAGIKALVEAQTAAIADLANKIIDAPTEAEKNELAQGIADIAVSVNAEVDELQAVIQANTPASNIV